MSGNGSNGVVIVDALESLIVFNEREIGREAIITINSAKPGNGVEQLRDNNLDTYWQSDGTFPHTITVQFTKKVLMTKVCLFLNHSIDEIYTPKRILLSIGTCPHDLIDIVGWVIFDLGKLLNINDNNTTATTAADDDKFIKTHYMQIKILSMHQNGKDTHIRQLKIFGQRAATRVMGDLTPEDFKTVTMGQFCMIR